MSNSDWNDYKDLIDLFGDPREDKNECLHLWKEYLGFTDHYFFCTKCDKKEKEEPKDVYNINKPWWA